MMDFVYVGCFAFGAIFTLASVAFGFGHDGGGDAGTDLAHADAGSTDGGQAHHLLGLLNLTSLTAGLTVFGALGLIVPRLQGPGGLILVAIAAVGGLIALAGVGSALRVLRAGERRMDPADYHLAGTLARVTAAIPENGVGEIVYTNQGRRWSRAARDVHSRALSRETEVMVIEEAQGVAIVQPWTEALEEGAAPPLPTPSPTTAL